MAQFVPTKKQEPKPKPDKQVLLKKLAAKRVPKAIKAIQLVGNLAAYDPNPAQVNTVLDALSVAMKATSDRLHKQTASIFSTFTL